MASKDAIPIAQNDLDDRQPPNEVTVRMPVHTDSELRQTQDRRAAPAGCLRM